MNFRPLPCLLLLAFIGCSSKPSESFLAQFKSIQEASRVPALTVHLGRSLEVSNLSGSDRLKMAVETLATQMGFRVEASKVRGGFFSDRTKYDFTGFQPPQFPGLSFQQEGENVRIKPSYKEEVILEWTKAPAEGFEYLAATQASSNEGLEVGLAAMGVKDSKAMLEKLAKAGAESRKAKAKTFEENVVRAMKDNRYTKAWLVQFRKRESTDLPADSPFWKLVESLPGGSASPVVEPDAAYRMCQSFFARKGQADTKATLRTYAVVAFQDANGKCAKTEPWSTFAAE